MSARDYTICVSCGGVGTLADLGSGEDRPCCICRKAEYGEWIAKMQPSTRRLAVLAENGQCCGRKPLAYKRPVPHLYCARCNAEFNPETGRQQANWAWVSDGDAFVAAHPTSDYAHIGQEVQV